MRAIRRVFLVVALLLIGGFATYQGGRMIANGFKSRDWLATEGRVVQSRVDTATANRTSGGLRRNTTEYRATIRYEYNVGGVAYTGDRITVERTGYSGQNRGAAENAIRDYASGTAVTVYYDPRDPATAVLRPGIAGPAAWLLLAAGPILLVSSLWAAFRARSRRGMPGRRP